MSTLYSSINTIFKYIFHLLNIFHSNHQLILQNDSHFKWYTCSWAAIIATLIYLCNLFNIMYVQFFIQSTFILFHIVVSLPLLLYASYNTFITSLITTTNTTNFIILLRDDIIQSNIPSLIYVTSLYCRHII